MAYIEDVMIWVHVLNLHGNDYKIRIVRTYEGLKAGPALINVYHQVTPTLTYLLSSEIIENDQTGEIKDDPEHYIRMAIL
jgi:hypothetical protein